MHMSLQSEVPKRKKKKRQKNTVEGENMIMTLVNNVVRSDYVYGVLIVYVS